MLHCADEEGDTFVDTAYALAIGMASNNAGFCYNQGYIVGCSGNLA